MIEFVILGVKSEDERGVDLFEIEIVCLLFCLWFWWFIGWEERVVGKVLIDEKV